MSILLKTLEEVLGDIAVRAKARRLVLNLTQKGLAERSGVSYGSIKRFETSGQIALTSLLKIAVVLDCLDGFETLFPYRDDLAARSLDDLLAEPKTRKRGSKS